MKRRRPVQVKKSLNIKSIFTLTAAFVLVAALSIGGTLAWLTAQTNTITNTFTGSDITVKLEETTENYKMVPGATIKKDPKATVVEGSENCWLFVEITKSTTPKLDDYITYTVASPWAPIEEGSNVYYIKVDGTTATVNTPYPILTNNQVTVKDNVTEAMMDAINAEGADKPTLSFKVYAVQLEAGETAAKAWDARPEATEAPVVTPTPAPAVK